jgi:hypothetical protein
MQLMHQRHRYDNLTLGSLAMTAGARIGTTSAPTETAVTTQLNAHQVIKSPAPLPRIDYEAAPPAVNCTAWSFLDEDN